MFHYQDAKLAINAAAAQAPSCIGYHRPHGWIIYKAQDGCPPDVEPEFFLVKQGFHPIPLTNDAWDVWISILRQASMS